MGIGCGDPRCTTSIHIQFCITPSSTIFKLTINMTPQRTLQSGTTYRIVNAKSDTSLDVSGANNYSLMGYPWYGGENQRWKLQQDDQGAYTIVNTASGKFVSFAGASVRQDGDPVVAVDEPTAWDIQPDKNNPSAFRYVLIILPDTSFNIDLSDHGNPAPGTPVTLWEQSEPGVNQTWFFEQV
ncbi:ricin B-like lectin [Pluteus cervinus]|uniref:Ricin B-like lectin n=1 Tax=Pluteus cervinus TaxID=181527 RepID=A0ACD3A7Q9_9AGAR|nr:ricin B-like lectin [Pluteus cervinus]